ncbi:hypothetical protein AB0O91_06350 [Kitasatospora sp. NPDC089797]|uniref:hypothetical protein n=1 Tax=Kitasatospora sp. NPDC089797 TaxID=3155298 RepID=UPI0034336124
MMGEASAEVVAERERLAERVRQELRAAGLPVVLPTEAPVVPAGALVSVDETTDEDFSEVAVSWNCHPRLQDCSRDAYRSNRWDDAAFRHSGVVHRAMIAAVIGILESAGFAARESPHEYEPLTVEVLSGPGVPPPWVVGDAR